MAPSRPFYSPRTPGTTTANYRHRTFTFSPSHSSSTSPLYSPRPDVAMQAPSDEVVDLEETCGFRLHLDCLEWYLMGQHGCPQCRRELSAAASRGGDELMCSFLLEVLGRFCHEPAMVAAVLRSVRGRVLTGQPACKDLLREAGLCHRLVELLSGPLAEDVLVAAEACETMAVLSTDSVVNQESLRAAGAAQAVSDALQLGVDGDRQQDMLHLTVMALQCASNLAWKNQSGQTALLAAGVAPRVLAAFDRFTQVGRRATF